MEPERNLLKYRGKECLNCFQPLDKSEKYCHNCGQLNSTKKLTFNDFFNEFFAGILAYDSRVYRTINSLLFNPGKISKDYVEGKRQRYANPYRFYLSASIVFFIIWGFTTDSEGIQEASAAANEISNEEIQREIDVAIADAELPVESPTKENSFTLLNEGETLEEIYLSQQELDTMGFWIRSATKMKIFSKFYDVNNITASTKAMEMLKYDPTSFNKWLYKKTIDLNLISSNPNLFIDYFFSKLPFIIFFYLPVFALFIWLVYVRRPFTYMEHLIFTFHNQTMWFVLFSIAIIIDYIFDSSTGKTIGTIFFLVYLYKAMRKFYHQGRVKTVLKFIIINGIFFILAVIATIFSLIASFAVY